MRWMLVALLPLTLSATAWAESSARPSNKPAQPASDDVFDMALPSDPAPAARAVTAAPPPPAPMPEPLITPPPPATQPATPNVWAQPTEADSRTPWNRQDPWNSWGSSNRLSFFLGVTPFIIGGAGGNTSAGGRTQAEVGLAYSIGSGIGFRLSTIQPFGLWSFSMTWLRNKGFRIFDLGDPDVSFGYAMIAPEFGVASDFSGSHTFVTAGLSLGGVRTVVGDLLSVDVRLTPAVWIAPSSSDSPLVSFALGLSFDVGLVH